MRFCAFRAIGLAFALFLGGCDASQPVSNPIGRRTPDPVWDGPNPAEPPGWPSDLLEDAEPLQNWPFVASTKIDGDEGVVTVGNIGTTTLMYSAAWPNRIQVFVESFVDDRWEKSAWDWCGTGYTMHVIPPGQQAEIGVQLYGPVRARISGMFSEAGTNRAGLFVLYAEPAEE